MGNTSRVSFRGYDFPGSFRPADESGTLDTAAQARPRGAGSVTQNGRRGVTRLLVYGELATQTPQEMDTALQAVKTRCYAGKGDLFFGRDDRLYRDAQAISWGVSNEQGKLHGVWCAVSIEFEAADYPEAFSIYPLAPVLSAAGGTVLSTTEATALPVWTITIGAGGSGPLTLTNAANGQTALLDPGTAGFAAGEVIVLTRDGYTVTRNGIASFGLLKLRIPAIEPGSNPITLTRGGTATVASLSLSYIPRYS